MKGKRFLVTGACGTIGKELVRQLVADYAPEEVLCVDNNETELFFLQQHYNECKNTKFLLCDVRDWDKMHQRMEGVNIVFHTAAFKHVHLCECSPDEAVQNNIVGLQKLIRSAAAAHVDRFIFTSSDKAVNPSSVMGTTKLMGERLVTAANATQRVRQTIFASTRFGNVLGSRGSVVPIFQQQIAQGGPVTVTDEAMTRFVMNIQRAVRLVLDSATLACGGEVFITKMPTVRIRDLADVMIQESAAQYGHTQQDIPVEIIGNKPGEKLFEELMSAEETRRCVELQDYFAVLPAFHNLYDNISYVYPDMAHDTIQTPYNSAVQTPLSHEALRTFLRESGLLCKQS